MKTPNIWWQPSFQTSGFPIIYWSHKSPWNGYIIYTGTELVPECTVWFHNHLHSRHRGTQPCADISRTVRFTYHASENLEECNQTSHNSLIWIDQDPTSNQQISRSGIRLAYLAVTILFHLGVTLFLYQHEGKSCSHSFAHSIVAKGFFISFSSCLSS